MKEKELYDLLQSLMPNDLQFINPYIDKAIPPLVDFAQMNILFVEDKARSQERQVSYNEEEKTVVIAYDQTRIYTIQLDFYGKNALENCNIFKQSLQVNLDRLSHIGKSTVGLKTMEATKNLTFFLENKTFFRRYSFNIDLYVIDSIEKEVKYLDLAKIKIKPYLY